MRLLLIMILMTSQIELNFIKNDKSRMKIAKKGKNKYFKLFNERKISKYIIDKSLGKKTFLF